jgi:hypothetical protein
MAKCGAVESHHVVVPARTTQHFVDHFALLAHRSPRLMYRSACIRRLRRYDTRVSIAVSRQELPLIERHSFTSRSSRTGSCSVRFGVRARTQNVRTHARQWGIRATNPHGQCRGSLRSPSAPEAAELVAVCGREPTTIGRAHIHRDIEPRTTPQDVVDHFTLLAHRKL